MVADGPRGRQTPTLLVRPPGVAPPEVALLVEVAAEAGMPLDEFQVAILEHGLAEGPDGLRAAIEVVLLLSRQNGKTVDLAVLLAGAMPILGCSSAIYSAHEFKTAKETFELTEHLILNSSLSQHYVKSLRGNNETSITMDQGRIRFLARTKGSGRGMGADLLILDEAFSVVAAQIGAVMPTLSARPNPQIWYASSAAMVDSEQLHALRRRATTADPERPPALCLMEWAAPRGSLRHDERAWAEANPALGGRLTYRFVRTEMESFEALGVDGIHEFERERLGWGDEPDGGTEVDVVTWRGLIDQASTIIRPLGLGLDFTPERNAASISVAGMRWDGNAHVEVVDNLAGLEWVVARVVDLHRRHKVPVWIQLGSPAATHIEILESKKVEVKTHPEGGGAAALFADAVKQGTLRHLGQASLLRAVTAARRRKIGERWTWGRLSTAEDITPVTSASLALYGALVEPPPAPHVPADVF